MGGRAVGVTYRETADRAARELQAAGFSARDSRIDVDVLARAVAGWDAAAWLTRQRETAPPEFVDALSAAILRRASREPVAYITGVREFYGRPFVVGPDVLIPRPETEMLVDAALEIAGAGPDPRTALRIADVGTGSGCLAVTLALEIPRAHVTATDISRAALDMAQRNAAHLGARVHFIETAFLGREHDFDLVVSNPPYVPESDAAALSPDVRDYEPAAALFGGLDGLSVIGRLLPAACAALRPGGWLVMEMGAGQSAAVRQLVAGHAWDAPRVVPDLAGIDRVLIVRRAAPSV